MQTRHPCIGRRHLEYVSCGSIGEFPETRQRCGERAEGAEVVRAAVAADGRSIKPEQPGDGPFGHPTVSAEFLAGLDTLAGDAYADALPTHPAAMVGLIVGFVGIRIRLTSGSSAQASLVSAADRPPTTAVLPGRTAHGSRSRSCLRTGLGLVRDPPFSRGRMHRRRPRGTSRSCPGHPVRQGPRDAVAATGQLWSTR